jgi:uncharacterized protein (DUF58 family)
MFGLARRLLRSLYRTHSLLFVLAALIAMAVLAAISGSWFFYRGAYVLGGLIVLCFFWARIHSRGLEVFVERANDRLQVGQEVEARVRLVSRSVFTKLWLELEDETNMPGAPARAVITLPSRGTKNWRVSMRCRRRGVYTAGPIRVTTGDPFGLFRFSRSYGERVPLIVLPRPQQLPYFWAPVAQLPGEGTVRKRTHYVTPNAAAVREYYPGDSYNRIHWRSTARLGRLMVKTFEMDPTSNIWVVLDLHKDVQAGSEDESTEEYGVRIATSLSYHFLETNRMLGLVASGSKGVTILDPARGPGQYARVLEAMALAEAEGQIPLARLLEEEGRRFGRHTTVIIVTSSASEEWVTVLQGLIHQGTRAAVVLMDPSSFGSPEETPTVLPLEALAASGVLTYVVRSGADLSLVLGPAGIASGGLERSAASGAGVPSRAPPGGHIGVRSEADRMSG